MILCAGGQDDSSLDATALSHFFFVLGQVGSLALPPSVHPLIPVDMQG